MESMATHSSILAWRISMDREKPGRLQSKGSQRVGLARVTKHSTAPLLLVLLRHNLYVHFGTLIVLINQGYA